MNGGAVVMRDLTAKGDQVNAQDQRDLNTMAVATHFDEYES